jgi:hypothetical protein
MISKTLKLIDRYMLVIEQGEAPPMEDPNQAQGQPQDVQDVTQQTPEETMPMSSAGEDEYIQNMIDAALFEPSPEEANTLLNLQSQMQMKKYTNAREEILPTVISIIGSSTQANGLKQNLNNIE